MNRYGKQFRCGIIIVLCISLLTGTGCSAWQGMSKTGQGATIGAGSGAAAGAGIGALVGGGRCMDRFFDRCCCRFWYRSFDRSENG